MQQFFGIMIAALYEINDSESILKHSVIYGALQQENEEQEGDILHHALYLSLAFKGVSPILKDFEEQILNLNLQVTYLKWRNQPYKNVDYVLQQCICRIDIDFAFI